MKIAIVGSRRFVNYAMFSSKVDEILKDTDKSNLIIVSGGALGVDSMAKDYAKYNKLGYLEFLPDYQKYEGKIAPLKRNELIANECDKMIAFQLNNSNGTNHVVALAKKLGKKVKLIKLTTNTWNE